MQQLRGRNALVTGAAGGLGEYIALSLAREGVNLALSDLPGEALERRVEEIRSRGAAVEGVPADLIDRGQAEGLAALAEEAIGPLDILVNNAGLEFAGPFLEVPPAEIDGLVQVNLVAPMLITQAALRGMLDRGRGHVVNVASLAGKIAFPYLGPYCASKHGVVAFTGSLRAEYGEEKVGFSAICPGFISGAGMFGRLQERVGEPPGLIRTLPPEKVGEAVVKAIRERRAELIVNRPGARPLILLSALAPRMAARFGREPRLREFADRFAREKRNAPQTEAEARVRAPD